VAAPVRGVCVGEKDSSQGERETRVAGGGGSLVRDKR